VLSFATEFAVSHARRVDGFFEALRRWILGSPHTVFQPDDLSEAGAPGEWTFQRGNEHLQTLTHVSGTREQGAARYTRADLGLEWVTVIVFSRWEIDSWVSIRVSCESEHPAVHLPTAKKPVLVRVLLEDLGGSADGVLNVGDTPYRLDNVDVDIAADLLLGRSGCRLPIVYVSASFDGKYHVNPERLARDLCGMAHVVVEPNRPFSLRLKIEVDAQNVYGGNIGVYWPEAAGRRSFFLARNDTPRDIEITISDEIRFALANRRPLDRCTWSASQGLVSRATFEALKADGSHEVNRYVEEFDKELAAKAGQFEDAEREIARLNAEIRKYEARSPVGSGVALGTGREQDLYPGEINDIVLDAIRDAVARALHDSRRQHVLEAIMNENKRVGAAAKIREELKDALRGMISIDAKLRRELQRLGFALSEDGKHWKLVLQGDDRYTFTLPKSGSDARGGLNSANDIARLFF
jgi:hypothetical protein